MGYKVLQSVVDVGVVLSRGNHAVSLNDIAILIVALVVIQVSFPPKTGPSLNLGSGLRGYGIIDYAELVTTGHH